MHNSTIVRIARKGVRNNFAKCFRKQSLIQIFYCLVHIFFARGNTALVIAIVTHFIVKSFSIKGAKNNGYWLRENQIFDIENQLSEMSRATYFSFLRLMSKPLAYA